LQRGTTRREAGKNRQLRLLTEKELGVQMSLPSGEGTNRRISTKKGGGNKREERKKEPAYKALKVR